MILIDDRTGSKELHPALSKRLDAQLVNLEFADFCFYGYGPERCIYKIGFERKTWRDLIGSLEKGRRLETHQIPGMAQEYDRRYLIVEGLVRRSYAGIIEEFRYKDKSWYELSRSERGWTWDRLFSKLQSIQEFGGVQIDYTRSESETVDLLVAKYNWWQKVYEDHDTYRAIKQPDKRAHTASGLVVADPLSDRFQEHSFLRTAIAMMPGVGWNKSEGVDKRFDSMLEACLAPERAWKEIAGIGKTLSSRIVQTLTKGGTGKF